MKDTIRIWRSPHSDFATDYDTDLMDETCTAVDVYTDEELSGIAKNGFNGIWVHAVPHHIVSALPFSELGKNAKTHQKKVNELIAHAAKYGIDVYFYLQMPRAVPLSETEFWENHPDCGGTMYESKNARSLCVSVPRVREWIENVSREITETMPGLGGLFLITASEMPAHCYSHRQRKNDPHFAIRCPRCGEREPAGIVTDIILAMHRGIRSKSSSFEFILWDWGWDMWGYLPPYRKILDNLPSDFTLMTTFEIGGSLDLWKHPRMLINEYSLIFPGPSDKCVVMKGYADRRGMRSIAKLQIGTTHELATVVSLPLMDSVYKKAVRLNRMGFDGFVGCWNFGNFYSANTVGFTRFLTLKRTENEKNELASFASDYFPGCDGTKTTGAWAAFGKAMLSYPFSMPFLYNSPANYTLGYHEIYERGSLSGISCGPSHLDAVRGDDLSRSVVCDTDNGLLPENMFPLDEVIEHLEHLAEHWDKAAELFAEAVSGSNSEHAELELNNIRLIGTIWHSLVNTYKAYRLRLNWNAGSEKKLSALARKELRILEKALVFTEKDRRQGFHPEAHARLFSPDHIRRKMDRLKMLYS
ncbi:MAG: hypothetical protein BWY31_01652 [Lentisphaerae bacterium ADurb.Bin242]|nr:MAG: hypothetical protein BWY31_01652 [Lentisphaerae bacterium ADurb.Bin242]